MSHGAQTGLIYVAIIAVVFLFISSAGRRRNRRTMQMQSGLDVGSRVMLTSGVFAEVVSLGEETIRVEIAPDVEITVLRRAVGQVLADEQDPSLEHDTDYIDEADEASADTDENSGTAGPARDALAASDPADLDDREDDPATKSATEDQAEARRMSEHSGSSDPADPAR